MEKFDIFSKLSAEMDDFDTGGYYIVGKPEGTEYKNSKHKGEKGGYYYSQKDTLEAIDMASASKYKTGIRDKENQLKTFLNIVNFYRDVMKMKININVSNYIFEPLSQDFEWPVWVMDRKFKLWAQTESYDDLLDEYGHDLATYGTTVTKRLKDCTERVPLRTLRNTQTAKSLYHAATNGGYVIIEPGDLHYNSMNDYPGWETKDLDKNKSYCCYERYGLVPEGLLKTWRTDPRNYECDKKEEWVLAQAILLPEERKKGEPLVGRIVWMEKLTEESFPLEEAHTEKVDGRWLGRGEIEKQLENQVSRNFTANNRRRGMLWAVKKIFQSSDDEVAKQLLMEVSDGEVLHVRQNGLISQVNTQSQHLADFQQDEEAWKENSQQISFAFNIATGENLPAGTPFSLAVVLDKAVSTHFTLVRNTFSNFLKRSFFDQIIPLFKDEHYDAHTVQIRLGASDIEHLKESIIVWHMNERVFQKVLAGERIDEEQIRNDILKEMMRSPYLFIKAEEGLYENAEAYMKLNIDEEIATDIASLTTLFQVLSQKGDPRAEGVLKQIYAKQGKSLDAIAGPVPEALPAAAPGAASAAPARPMQAAV